MVFPMAQTTKGVHVPERTTSLNRHLCKRLPESRQPQRHNFIKGLRLYAALSEEISLLSSTTFGIRVHTAHQNNFGRYRSGQTRIFQEQALHGFIDA